MLRWILGGREAQSSVELQVLKGHFDIVRFLVQIDDFRFASAGDDGLVLVWNIECLLVLERLSVWVSGGEELCIWDQNFQLLCHRQKHSDTGITALIELPKNCIAAAVDKDIVIYRLMVSADSSVTLTDISRCTDHHDQIRALINVNDQIFASGSHAGELILWDSSDFSNLAYEHILWEESQSSCQSEIKLAAPKPSEMSIQHLTTNGRLILAAVGSGLYVYDVVTKAVVAYRKAAHDSNVLHTMLLSDSELLSCSEDGSVRMWEIQDLPLAAEPASAGFFGMWSFGRSSKQPGPQAKKVLEIPNLKTLELIGDLIGHSGAIQMFLSFKEKGLVTCSTDHLLILWKDGERQSRLRSQALFQKLEENGGL
uniref:WD repeat domain 41 n=1 Tax=Cyprinodon variegatus TaxID=28743 RepID=A0A3Q2E6P0_CYPVA